MNDADEQIILVDHQDRTTGLAPKLEGHRAGLLHRALSVILRDKNGRLLMQKRHIHKYHSGGLWTNSCCSHPRPGEPIMVAACRRLYEEMGIGCTLSHLLTTHYRAQLDNGMTEHEIVHVFGGVYNGAVKPNPDEADGFAWIEPQALASDIEQSPERYSVWFRKYAKDHWHDLTENSVWNSLAQAN